MKASSLLASASGLVILLTSQRSSAAMCASSTLFVPSVVKDTAGALQLAQAINCSDGIFDVNWVGSVVVEQGIRVSDGTSLSIVGTPDGSSVVNGAGKDSLFHVNASTLRLSGLSLIDGRSGGSGGAIHATDSVIASDNCTFFNNTAVRGVGGAVYLKHSVLDATDSNFTGNFAQYFGGALSGNGSNITLSGNTIWGENQAYFGGGISLWSSTAQLSGNSNFTGNNASKYGGGAITMFTGSKLMVNGSSQFVKNFARANGGAIRAAEKSTLIISSETVWEKNQADEDGGGLWLNNATAQFDGKTLCHRNQASSGGCLLMRSGSSLDVTDEADFIGNHVSLDGGAAYIGDSCTLSVRDSLYMANNSAAEGGGLYSYFGTVTIEGSAMFEANQASQQGGGVGVAVVSLLEVRASGSAVFSQNHAGDDGGGLFISDHSNLSVTGQASFVNNSATAGAGLFMSEDSSLSFIDGGVTLSGNNASSRGGGMHVEGNQQFRIEGTRFLSNFAGTTGGAISGHSNGEVGDPATVSDCSFGGNEAVDAGGAVFIAGGLVDIIGSEFDGNTAGRSGGAIMVSGTAGLHACKFDGNHAPLGPAVSNTVSVTLNGTEFRNNTLWCDDEGLFLDWKHVSAYKVACDACPLECTDDCFIQDPDNAQLCEPVLKNTASPTVDGTLESLYVSPGYWRSSNTSRDVKKCYEPDSCIGGTEEYCDTGYKGPFCAVCSAHHTPGLGYSCFECTEARRNSTIGVGLVLLLVAAMTVAVGVRYLGSSAEEPAAEGIRSRMLRRFERTRVSQGLKLVIVSWQIVSQFSSVVSVAYPAVYESFVGYIDVVDLNLVWMLSAKCWVDTDFYDALLGTTIGPLVVSGIVLVSYILRSRRCPAHDDQDRRSRINHRHATFMYLVSFLVYTNASSRIFQTFACVDLDTGDSFLRADHSIKCNTPKHQAYMVYAGFMCLVYPFGIPFCYAAILYQARDGLKSDDETIRQNATVLRALWTPYRRDVYYYEVVECFRRVTLSGLVVFVLPNTAGQVITTFLLSLLFFALFTVLNPYTNTWDTWLARIGHAIVMMSMFIALAVKVEIGDDDKFSQEVFATVLVLANCVMILTVVVEAYGMCSVVVEEIRGSVATTNV